MLNVLVVMLNEVKLCCNDMDKLISHCIEDMKSVAQTSRHTLAAQIRAYDLLQLLGERAEDALYGADCCGICVSEEACRAFSETFRQHSDRLETAYDEAVLRNELNAVLRPLEDAVAEARFEAASAAALHEFAKEVFEIWQTGGVFARRRALKELRARAGFRLESHRIGNYVAKTFDLANEAQVRFAAAQQQLFKEDVSYKLRPGLYGEIYRLLLP